MTFEVWVKGYTQASLFLTSLPTGWADGLKLPQLVVKTLSPEGCVWNGNMGRENQHFKSSSSVLEPAHSGPGEPTMYISS